MLYRLEDYRETAAYIKAQLAEGFLADTAIILGSGLGNFADCLLNARLLSYRDIPHFPVTTVTSHKGTWVCGYLDGQPVHCLSGRFHYYEGYRMEEVVYAVRVLSLLGVKKLILTNAAGAINAAFRVGEFMLLTDYLKLFDDSPARGQLPPEFGPRFFDMTCPYDRSLRKAAKKGAAAAGITLHEGVYAFMSGPQFETAAEIRMLRSLGADAVGMSTVPETIAAVQCGMRVMGISLLSNMAAGILDAPLSDDEVVSVGERSAECFTRLLKEILTKIAGV